MRFGVRPERLDAAVQRGEVTGAFAKRLLAAHVGITGLLAHSVRDEQPWGTATVREERSQNLNEKSRRCVFG